MSACVKLTNPDLDLHRKCLRLHVCECHLLPGYLIAVCLPARLCVTGNNISAGSGSIFLSETELSSDEDTLFLNGGSKIDANNLKKSADMVKANNLRNKMKA